jgi:hypothetical protein
MLVQSLTGTSGGGGFSGRAAGARRDESLVGRSLNIMRGPHRYLAAVTPHEHYSRLMSMHHSTQTTVLHCLTNNRRGYRGRVASATETHCRIELEAQYKTVTVKRSDLKLEGQNGVSGSRTPSSPWDAPITPAHPGMLPVAPLSDCMAHRLRSSLQVSISNIFSRIMRRPCTSTQAHACMTGCHVTAMPCCRCSAA